MNFLYKGISSYEQDGHHGYKYQTNFKILLQDQKAYDFEILREGNVALQS